MAPWDRYNLQLQLLSYWKSSLQILLTKFSAIYLCFSEIKIKICFWHTVFQSSWLRTSRIFPLYRVIQTSSAANCSGSLSHTNQWKASRTSCWLFYHERQHREISSKAARRIFINCVYFLVQNHVRNHPSSEKNPHHSPVNVLHGNEATVIHNTFLHSSFWKWLHEDDTLSFLMTCPMFWGRSVLDIIVDVEQMSLWRNSPVPNGRFWAELLGSCWCYETWHTGSFSCADQNWIWTHLGSACRRPLFQDGGRPIGLIRAGKHNFHGNRSKSSL